MFINVNTFNILKRLNNTMEKQTTEKQIWELTKKLNDMLNEYEDEPALSIEVVEFLQSGGY